MDSLLRKEITSQVSQVVADTMEVYGERWVSGDTLQQHCEIFTRSWLKAYGKCLPRTQAAVQLEDGSVKRTKWIYPLHKIQKMINDGQIKYLSVNS
jgi:hypothetical protein